MEASSRAQHSVMNLGCAVYGSPAISSASGLVFLGSVDGRLRALDVSNMTNERWSYDMRTVEGKPEVTVRSSPALINGGMYVVAGDPHNRYLYCFGD